MTDKMVGWHHQLNGYEFEQAPGDGEGQGSLECCSPWGHKEWDMTEWLNTNNKVSNPLSKNSEVSVQVLDCMVRLSSCGCTILCSYQQ